MNKKSNIALFIVAGALIIAACIFLYLNPEIRASLMNSDSIGLSASPTSCHGDAGGIAYWRADKVNLAYFEKEGKIYYCNTEQGGNPIEVSTDVTNFEFISGGLTSDDPLHELVPVYAKDSERVYANYIVLNKADPATFKLLDPVGIGTDSTHIYFGSHMLDSAEWYPSTLSTKWPTHYYSIDSTGSPSILRLFAEINGNHVSLNMYSGEVVSMPGVAVDIATFETLYGAAAPHLYARDKQQVYCWNTTPTPVVVSGADPATFRSASRLDISAAQEKGITVDGLDAASYYYQCKGVGSI